VGLGVGNRGGTCHLAITPGGYLADGSAAPAALRNQTGMLQINGNVFNRSGITLPFIHFPGYNLVPPYTNLV
jgi:hypothetical protein